MGWVYLARDRHLSDRWVVLKGLLNSADANAVAAAIAERQFLAEVEHPLIVQIYNFTTHAGAGYLVMEYVGGTSLKQMLVARNAQAGRVDPMPVDQALAYIMEILPAFTYLHDNGMLYCDFKPENLICRGESVTLIDLGGVRRIDDHQSLLFGTVGFQGPEVPTEGPSVASDVFTIGRTLATLVLDFKGNTTTYATSLPPVDQTPVFARYDSFYRLLARACAFDPDDRFATVDEMRVQMLGVLREVVATDRGLGSAARASTASELFASPVVEVADRPLFASELPALRPDEDDPMFAWLTGLTATDPGVLFATLGTAPQPTAEVLLARAQMAVTAVVTEERSSAGWSVQARHAIEQLLDMDPWDWRAAWLSGLLELTEGATVGPPSQMESCVAARASFNAVYGQVPGELAPKLALATACELSGELDVAESLYLICAAIDASYTSLAAFGLSRIRQKRGDIAGAVVALDMVGPTRGAYQQARMMRAQLASRPSPAPGMAPPQVPPTAVRVPGPHPVATGPLPALLGPPPGAPGPPAAPVPPPAAATETRRLAGLAGMGVMDYQFRPASDAAAVWAVCQEIKTQSDPAAMRNWTGIVRLSGIDWQVLDVAADGHALLLSERVLTTGPYHTAQTEVTWSQCSVRQWLNQMFGPSLGAPLNERVPAVAVRNAPNSTWGATGGPDTKDQFFLLSHEEASFLGGEEVGAAGETVNLANPGRLLANDDKGAPTWWWLRSPGAHPDTAVHVRIDGSIANAGAKVTMPGGIRPAFWLSLR